MLKPRAWEEFEGDPEARGSIQEDRSRSDDIITPPTALPGYQYRKVRCVQVSKRECGISHEVYLYSLPIAQ